MPAQPFWQSVFYPFCCAAAGRVRLEDSGVVYSLPLHIVGLRHEVRGDAQKDRQVIYAVEHCVGDIIPYWELEAPVLC